MIAPPIPNLLMIKSLVLAIVVSSQMLLISESGDESLLNCLDKVNPKTTVLMREQTNKQKKNHRGMGYVKEEAETGVMWPQAK